MSRAKPALYDVVNFVIACMYQLFFTDCVIINVWNWSPTISFSSLTTFKRSTKCWFLKFCAMKTLFWALIVFKLSVLCVHCIDVCFHSESAVRWDLLSHSVSWHILSSVASVILSELIYKYWLAAEVLQCCPRGKGWARHCTTVGSYFSLSIRANSQ